jgi:hypothetical protein
MMNGQLDESKNLASTTTQPPATASQPPHFFFKQSILFPRPTKKKTKL